MRWGGEEFLLVLKACDLGEAQRIAEKLRQSVEQTPVVAEGKPVAATVSIGVAAFDGTETPEKLVDRADQALYRAKHAGRNRVEISG